MRLSRKASAGHRRMVTFALTVDDWICHANDASRQRNRQYSAMLAILTRKDLVTQALILEHQ